MFEKSLTNEQKEKVEIKSAGVATFGGDMATEGAISAMKSRQIDISNHRSSALKFSDLSDTDLFVCMSQSHKAVLSANGVSDEKIICLEVSDPFGSDIEVYQECAKEIAQKLSEVKEKINL